MHDKENLPSWMPTKTNEMIVKKEEELTSDDEEWENHRHVYIIRWRRETGVSDWNFMNVLGQVELLGQSAPKVMQHVNEYMIQDTPGIQTETGVYENVYLHEEDAERIGLRECMRLQLQFARRGIRSVLGLSMSEYYHLLKETEITESKNEKYPLHDEHASQQDTCSPGSVSTKPQSFSSEETPSLSSPTSSYDTHKSETKEKSAQQQRQGCLIKWGMNSLYNKRTASDLHLCNEILTDVSMWVEKKTLL